MVDHEIDLYNRSIVIAALDPAGELIKRRPRLPCSRPSSTATAGAVIGYRVAVEQNVKKSSGPATRTPGDQGYPFDFVHARAPWWASIKNFT
jgi:hypothetical protein